MKRAKGLLRKACRIASAYVAHNHVAASAVPALIAVLHASLAELALQKPAPEKDWETPIKISATQIKRSITPDALISFIDGKSYKTLKRHLNAHGLTPTIYRELFGLPSDYPMVAPSYARRRSAIAKGMGLGLKGRRREQGRLSMSSPVPQAKS